MKNENININNNNNTQQSIKETLGCIIFRRGSLNFQRASFIYAVIREEPQGQADLFFAFWMLLLAGFFPFPLHMLVRLCDGCVERHCFVPHVLFVFNSQVEILKNSIKSIVITLKCFSASQVNLKQLTRMWPPLTGEPAQCQAAWKKSAAASRRSAHWAQWTSLACWPKSHWQLEATAAGTSRAQWPKMSNAQFTTISHSSASANATSQTKSRLRWDIQKQCFIFLNECFIIHKWCFIFLDECFILSLCFPGIPS